MFYHLIAPLKNKTPPLTYFSKERHQKGAIVNIHLRNKTLLGVVLEEVSKPSFECLELEKTPYFLLPFQIELALFIAQYYSANLSSVLNLFTPFKECDLVGLEKIEPVLNALSQTQTNALKELQKHSASLLFGDTGSGKTEIYMHSIAQTLEQKKSALLLVPEIALTPQMQQRLKRVFKENLGLWHSKLSQTQKKQFLEKLYSQEIKLVVGTRSALFLPLKELGLIIVDEEHDFSYKSHQSPMYNARDLCLYLSHKFPIQVILGSATPSLNSYKRFKDKALVRLKGRYTPTQKNIIFEKTERFITPKLLEALKQVIDKNEQAIIFVPTRANFKTLLCQNCYKSVQCPFCSVNMSLHLKTHKLMCHYCHFSSPIPKICSACQSEVLVGGKRIGTMQVLNELEGLLKGAKIAILDKDHTSTPKKLHNILNDFNAQKTNILIGTQMISKGHDYAKVSLAVVLGIDNIIKSNSYRALEEGVSLLYQIAGRSARQISGQVFIQSTETDLLENFLEDYEDFLQYELQERCELYPPFSRLCLLEFKHKNEEKAQQLSLKASQTLSSCLEKGVTLSSFKAPIEKIASSYRYLILLRSKNPLSLIKSVHAFLKTAPNIPCSVNMDPVDIF
ncbi:primosome assembly protein PriA [Helicobacter pylori F32]|uniref:primosomal protein N' n=1 Tax=Helicobacter pylori TaxID=210 RepID=UPI0001F46513|nr:primosomal protein N' [Helicobacter pylori]WRC22491.1 primosomal protein N' [Helicobacter pylori]BAJ57919.1 primosome assembly protein PriA [Helicobacter pylori F32]